MSTKWRQDKQTRASTHRANPASIRVDGVTLKTSRNSLERGGVEEVRVIVTITTGENPLRHNEFYS